MRCAGARVSVRLADVIAAMDAAYPPALAESWDSVGLVCGDPADAVSRILLAVDATAAVVDEALGWGAQALVVHHPLLLRGVDTVGAHTPKGALVHRLIRGGCALFTAHTNADSADPGVSDALAAAIGLRVTGPLDPAPAPPVDKWAVMVPSTDTDRVQAALFAAGAGRIGDYAECSWRVGGVGQFRPLAGANPTIGAVGGVERVAEDRVEMVASRRLRGDLVDGAARGAPVRGTRVRRLRTRRRAGCCGPRSGGGVGRAGVVAGIHRPRARRAAGDGVGGARGRRRRTRRCAPSRCAAGPGTPFSAR